MRLLSILLCAGLLPGVAQANELLRVYQLALDNDAQIQAAAKARDAALETKPLARGALYPQVSAGASSSLVREKNTNRFGTSSDTSEPYNLGLNLSQALYDRELWTRLQQADDQVAAAEATYRAAQQSLALRLSEAYFNLLAAADSLRFANAENKAVERSLEQAKQRFEVGLSAITDVQEAQARYDLTVAQKIEAEQALSSAREAVAEITGSSDSAVVPLQEEIPLNRPDPDDVQAWLKAAADNNLDIVAARIQSEIASKDIKIRNSGHYPTLSLNGSVASGETSGGLPTEYDQSEVQLQLNIPIYSGGQVQSSVRAATSTHEQRLAQLEGARRAAGRRTRDAYQGVIAGVSRVKALKQAVLSNTTALEASEVGLQVGARTAVDVLNAQRELYRAQRDYARARYDYLLNVLRLKLAAGRLGAQDLQEIDRLLTSADVELAQ